MQNKKNQRTYKTTSFYLACFLVCKGLQIVGLDKLSSDSKRAVFVFADSSEISELVDEFNFNSRLTVKLKDFIEAQRQLKTILYEYIKNKKKENEYFKKRK